MECTVNRMSICWWMLVLVHMFCYIELRLCLCARFSLAFNIYFLVVVLLFFVLSRVLFIFLIKIGCACFDTICRRRRKKSKLVMIHIQNVSAPSSIFHFSLVWFNLVWCGFTFTYFKCKCVYFQVPFSVHNVSCARTHTPLCLE